ncbi:MAG TPA: DinB family protein [Vicinamibacteria bacterium]|nr:DinB family protein [Vicinamibacteria bacterium]
MDAIEILLGLLDEAFDKSAWHGPNLRGSLRGVTAHLAARRPSPGRHNVWEVAVHAAYWKYAARRRLTGEKRGSFALGGSNWFRRPGPEGSTEAAWRADVALLVAEHRKLRAAVEKLSPSALSLITPGSRRTNLAVIRGIAAHDLYHAGQIQLLKRLGRG